MMETITATFTGTIIVTGMYTMLMETISGAITIAGQESGLAPVTVMITITKLELNLKCNIPVLVIYPKAVLNLNSKMAEH